MSSSIPSYTPVHLSKDDDDVRKGEIAAVIESQLTRIHDILDAVDSAPNKQVSVHFDKEHQELVFEKALSTIYDIPFDVFAKGLRDTVHDLGEQTALENGRAELLDVIDSDTIYKRHIYHLNNDIPDVHVNFLFHTKATADSLLWLGQSILDDARYPLPPNAFHSHERIWCIVEPIGSSQTRLLKIRHIRLIPPTTTPPVPVGAIAAILLSCYAANLDLFEHMVHSKVMASHDNVMGSVKTSIDPTRQVNNVEPTLTMHVRDDGGAPTLVP
ncbi:Aste57867_15801 [Aphanomyces stellatus]|uniref:Aste57867_15801 protein n=1 Tax=Aphanomyces stellatus TaxID=120398 RepID=A0A485L4Y3_9STRA|nr:hypothetical protein As57867_015745 [Aphanomyces stellatus]VFT92589.1 Aste57867_15801 [Aphanomyces stellatus]